MAAAKVDLLLPCGGQGRCGRCLVVVRKGGVRRRSVAKLSSEEIERGYALACQTVVEGDVTVYVPPQDGIQARPETSASATRAAGAIAVREPSDSPWVVKYHLVIAPPTLEDNTTDFERLKRELARQFGLRDLSASLSVLKRLAGVLRDANWDVTAVVERGTWLDPEGRPRLLDVRPGDTSPRTLGVAVDIGTTSNVVYMSDLASGDFVGQAATYNGQIACGEDVISRIIYARREGGLDRLQRLGRETINGLIDKLLREHGALADDIYLMHVAGNPTMIHLFLGLDPQYIRLEPYVPTIEHPMPVRAGELGLHIHPEATVDCLPGVGAYVGADITAGVLRSGMTEGEALTLFIDMGTNGELVLGNQDWLISCACSAGPAFEGSGVASGMRATAGAIDEVWIDPKTAEPTYRTIADAPPRGICGSGMISLLGEMFITGIVDKGGRVDLSLDTPRVRKGPDGPEYVVVWAEGVDATTPERPQDLFPISQSETATTPVERRQDIVLTEVDIQNLLRAKAAVYAGANVLASSVGIGMDDIERVLIGGAFGEYIDLEKAIEIGLLPDMPWERFSYLGNTSIQGAHLCLLCRDQRAKVMDIGRMMTYLELSADNSFMDAFTSALFLPHTDLETFPSVKKKLV